MEYMQALQSTFDDQKPSLFELISERQLASLLPPSLRYLLAVATHQNPRYLLRILNSFDELYALLMLVVERFFLKTYGGGFTENFYSLKREKALKVEIPRAQIGAQALVRETLALTERDIWKNLAVMVGLPYLKRKLDESYDINAPRALLGAAYTRMPVNPTLKQRFTHYYRWFLTHIYPGVNATYYFSLLAFNLAYLFDGTKFSSPLLWLIGTRVRRLGRADFAAIAAMDAPTKSSGGLPGTTSIFSPRVIGSRLLSSLSILLPTSIFALKFLEWWHASDFARQLGKKATEGIELPPPIVAGLHALESGEKSSVKEGQVSDDDPVPENPPIAAQTLLPIFVVAPSKDSALCSICKQEMQTATACQTGYVFCYTCIHRWLNGEHDVQENFMKQADRQGKWENGYGRCPISGSRVLGGTEGLRRIIV